MTDTTATLDPQTQTQTLEQTSLLDQVIGATKQTESTVAKIGRAHV